MCKTGKEERKISPGELRLHSRRGDAWVLVRDGVYDVTRFADSHPGGAIIYHFAGRDATSVFEANHVLTNPTVAKKLRHQRIGTIDWTSNGQQDAGAAEGNSGKTTGKTAERGVKHDAKSSNNKGNEGNNNDDDGVKGDVKGSSKVHHPPPARVPSPLEADYRRMHDEIRAEGLYDADPWFYAGKVSVVLGFLAACVAVTLCEACRDRWWAPWVAGLFLSQFWHQSAFIVHDALHNAITHNRKIDQAIGWLFGTVFISIPSLWWRDNHHMHHCLTNSMETGPTKAIPSTGGCVDKPAHWNGPSSWHGDPQMYYAPIWRTDKRMTKVDSGERGSLSRAVFSVLHAVQHLTFLPLHLVVGRWNIYVLAIINLFKMGSAKEVLGLAMYWSWFVTLASHWATTRRELAIFLLVSHTLAGIMHLQLNLTHFAMPMLHRSEIDAMGFAESQIGTARNIDYKWWTTWYHGGLDLQIEHHLFPMLPRHRLKYVRDKYVLPLCEKHGVKYTSEGFFRSVWVVLGDLHEISRDPLGDAPHGHCHSE